MALARSLRRAPRGRDRSSNVGLEPLELGAEGHLLQLRLDDRRHRQDVDAYLSAQREDFDQIIVAAVVRKPRRST